MHHIEVKNLSKTFKRYSNPWSRLVEWLMPWGKQRFTPIDVLSQISFSVARGEALGIVGLNGAGKSTLLKIITGTLKPSSGLVQTQGSVTALLELGLGFHSEFSGRENIFLASQLLGHSHQTVKTLLPQIEAFAEIGEYIHEPLRTYSSGMQVRLAFSVATAVRPDILIIDEALSVGDSYFQHKSFQRIREFQRQGTTLLIVSHDKNTIQAICDRAILLNYGKLICDDKPEVVMNHYNAMLAQKEIPPTIELGALGQGAITQSGDGQAQIIDVVLRDHQHQMIEVVQVGQAVSLTIRFRTQEALPNLVIGYLLKDRLGQSVFGTNTHHLQHSLPTLQPDQEYSVSFEFVANLGVGHYSVSVALHENDTHLERHYAWRDGALYFQVVNAKHPHFEGLAWLPPTIKIHE